jgi:hypothetical protein
LEIELPRLGHRLPEQVLSASEIELVTMQADVADPLGLRDRAILTASRPLDLNSPEYEIVIQLWIVAFGRR